MCFKISVAHSKLAFFAATRFRTVFPLAGSVSIKFAMFLLSSFAFYPIRPKVLAQCFHWLAGPMRTLVVEPLLFCSHLPMNLGFLAGLYYEISDHRVFDAILEVVD